MTIGDIKIKIGGDIQSLKKSLKRAEFRLQRSGRKLAELGSRLSASITLPILAIGGASLKTAGDLQSLKMGMESMMGSAEAAKVEIAKLRKEALKPGLNFEQALKGSVRLQAVKVDADIARRALAGFGNAIALVGGTGEQLEGVTLALSQIAAKGKISAEEINQLAERVPQIRQILKDGFGTADTEELQKLGIGFEEFITKSIIELEKLPKAQAGIKNSIENTKLALQEAAAVIGERLFPTFEKISAVVLRVANVFSNLPINIQDNIIQFALLAAAIGPVLSVMGSLKIAAGTLLGGLGKGLSIIRVGFMGLLSPLGLLAAALAGAAYVIVTNWGEGKKVLVNVANAFVDIYKKSTLVRGAIEFAIVQFKTLWNVAKSFINGVISGFTRIGAIFKAVVLGQWEKIPSLISTAFDDAMAGVSDTASQFGKDVSEAYTNAIEGRDGVSYITEKDIDKTTDKLSQILADVKAKFLGSGIGESVIDNVLGDLSGDFARDPKGGGGGGKADQAAGFGTFTGEAADINTQTSLLPEGLQAHVEKVQELSDKYKALRETLTPIQSVFVEMGKSISDALAQGAKSFKDFAKSALSAIADVIGAQIKLGVTKAITSAIGNAGPFGLALAGIAGGLAAGLFKTAIGKIQAPKLAKGGLAYGETLATVGDNPRANIDPEVIAPLSKLKNMLGGQTVNVQVTGEGRLRGTDIVYIYDAIVNQKKRYGIG